LPTSEATYETEQLNLRNCVMEMEKKYCIRLLGATVLLSLAFPTIATLIFAVLRASDLRCKLYSNKGKRFLVIK
jgi:hypothetical protein